MVELPMTAVTKTFDARGLGCPMVMIELNKSIHGLSIGDVLEFISGETFIRQDIYSWSKRTGHEVLDASEKTGVVHFLIRKAERLRTIRRPKTL